MRIDETTYHEYVNFKLENKDFLDKLEAEGNDIYYRFKHVLDVVEYLYNSLVDKEDYGEQEHIIFETGYFYIVTQVEEIKDLLKTFYNNSIVNLNNNAKEVNLLLNTYDFQTEVSNYQDLDSKHIESLLEFDKKIIKYLESKESIPEKLYIELDNLVSKLYEDLEMDYYTLNTIFLEIAEQYNII